MKKTFIPLTIALLMVVTGCNKNTNTTGNSNTGSESTTPVNPSCEHNWSDWSIKVEPTLTQEGVLSRTCSVCGGEETQPLANLSDTSVWTRSVYDEADCTHTGMDEYTSIYGTIYVDTPKTDHKFGPKYYIGEDYFTRYELVQKCDVCGALGGEKYLEFKPKELNNITDEDEQYSFEYNSVANTYTSTNKGVDNSSSVMIFKAGLSGELSFEYDVSSEPSCDALYVTKNGSGVSNAYFISGYNKKTTDPITVQLVTGDVVKFEFRKDKTGFGNSDDQAIIKNLTFTTEETLNYQAISYDSQGGSFCEPSLLVNGKAYYDVPTSTRDGYYFDGWYMDIDCTRRWTNDVVVNKDTLVYAGWVSEDDANIFRGEYKGFQMTGYPFSMSSDDSGDVSWDVDDSKKNYGSLSISTSSISIDMNGNVSGAFKGTIDNSYDKVTGKVTFETNNCVYLPEVDALMIVSKSSWENNAKYYFFFRNSDFSSTDVSGSYLESGRIKTLHFPAINGYSSLTLDLSKEKIMWNTYLEDLGGQKVLEENIGSSIGFTLKSSKGNKIEYYGNNGANLVKEEDCDGYQGKYTSGEHYILVNGATKIYDEEGDPITHNHSYVIKGENTIQNDSTSYPYIYNLDKNTHTYTREVPQTVIHLNMMGVLENIDLNVVAGSWIDLPQPDHKDWGFDGWFEEEDFKTKVSNRYRVPGETTLYAKWLPKYTVTLHRNNEDGNYVLKVKEGTTPAFPNFTYEDHQFMGWFYDEGFNKPFGEKDVITSDIDLYAKWIEEPWFYGTFKGLWCTGSFGSYTTKDLSDSEAITLTMNKDGTYSSNSTRYASGKFDNTATMGDDGYVELGLNSSKNMQTTKVVKASDGQVFMTGAYSEFAESPVQTGNTIFAKTNETVSLKFTSCANEYALYQYTVGEQNYLLYSNSSKNIFIVNPVLKDSNGDLLTFEDFASGCKYIAIYKEDGITKVDTLVQDGSYDRLTEADIYYGTYSGLLYGANVTLKLDGIGGATITNSGAQTIATYSSNGDSSIVLRYSGEKLIIHLDFDNNSFTQQLDGYEGTYTGSIGDLILFGWGEGTLNGESVKYVVDGGYITLTKEDGTSVTYEFDVENKTYNAPESLSPFSGLTYSGKYYDKWDESNNSYKIVFASGAEISGRLSIGMGYYWWDFSGEYDESTQTLTLTVTAAYTDYASRYANKQIVFTVNGNTMTCTKAEIEWSSGMYSLKGSTVTLQ